MVKGDRSRYRYNVGRKRDSVDMAEKEYIVKGSFSQPRPDIGCAYGISYSYRRDPNV